MQDVDKKVNNKFVGSRDKLENLKNNILIKKKKYEEELYTKQTLTNLIGKMKSDILIMKKNIFDDTKVVEKDRRELEFQKFKKNEIKEKYNKLHSSMENVDNNNLKFFKENDYLLKYYGTVIEQKKCFKKIVYNYN